MYDVMVVDTIVIVTHVVGVPKRKPLEVYLTLLPNDVLKTAKVVVWTTQLKLSRAETWPVGHTVTHVPATPDAPVVLDISSPLGHVNAQDNPNEKA